MLPFSFTVYCSVLFYSVLQRSLLQCNAAFSVFYSVLSVLFYIVLQCSQSFTAYCSVLFYSVWKRSILQCTAAVLVFYSVLQRSLLQHIKTFSFTVHCSVLFYLWRLVLFCFCRRAGGGGGGGGGDRKSGTGMAQCGGPGVPTRLPSEPAQPLAPQAG